MKAADVLKPKSKEEIDSILSFGRHFYRTLPANQLGTYLKAGLLWVFVGLALAYAFSWPAIHCTVVKFFDYHNYYDDVEDIFDSKFFDRLGGYMRKHGTLDKWG